MKTIFLKKIVPYLVILTVGTVGAFTTSSIEKSAEKAPPKLGYVIDEDNIPCNKPVSCNHFGEDFCRVSYPFGEQAKGRDANCQEILYRENDN